MAEETPTMNIAIVKIGPTDAGEIIQEIHEFLTEEAKRTDTPIELFNYYPHTRNVDRIILVYTGPSSDVCDVTNEFTAIEHVFKKGRFDVSIPVIAASSYESTVQSIRSRRIKVSEPLKYTADRKTRCLEEIWLAVTGKISKGIQPDDSLKALTSLKAFF